MKVFLLVKYNKIIVNKNIMSSFINIINSIKKFVNNPKIQLFIILCLICLILFYYIIDYQIRNTISIILSNPLILLLIFISLIIIGYINIIIGLLSLIFIYIAINNINIIQLNKLHDNILSNNDNTEEHFKNIIELNKKKEKETDEQVNSIKNIVLNTINKFKSNNDNSYKTALLENKRKQYITEKTINDDNILENENNNELLDDANLKNDNKNNKKNDKKNKNGKESFKTIKYRTFNPTNEDDTNLLITKEILNDIINRINYNYETTPYLKKYIKNRIEEIITINNLANDDD